MRLLIAFLLFLFFVPCFGQVFPGVSVKDRRNPDLDNSIFVPGRTFMYRLTTSGSNEYPDSLSYTVLSVKKSKRTAKGQTEVAISSKPDNGRYEATGAIENNENVWLHPPRGGKLGDLEVTPFPYVRLPLSAQKEWKDQNVIRDVWSKGRWKGKLKCEISYKVLRSKQIEVEERSTDSWLIEGLLSSAAGTSKAVFEFNMISGFTSMKFTTLDDEEFTFDLIAVTDDEPLLSFEHFILDVRGK